MSKIFENMEDLIGRTPILQLNNIKSNVYVKLELFNPAGSVKDRIALNMIQEAEEKGLIREGSTIIEPTSGNTGIGLASIAAARGYKAILTMPETMSIERRKLLAGYGAQIVLTDGKAGMRGAIAKANELAEEIEGGIVLGQFSNPDNPKAHYRTTGPEIWEDMDGEVDIFVAGVGTGGTLTGVGTYLKEKKPEIQIVAVEPESSPVLSGGNPGPHGIQGIGAGFIPEILNRDVIDDIIQVSNELAYEGSRLLAHKEGVLTGISSGAALSAALELSNREENRNKKIVVLLPDTGERYLSTPLFS